MPGNNYARTTNYQAVFRRDAEAMLIAFAEKKEASFRIFAEIWKEYRGYMIFSARAYIPNVYRFFFEDAVRVVGEYLVNTDYNYYTRIGALYMYHIMYHSQESHLKDKVRMTQLDWVGLNDLISDSKRQNHEHVAHIFNLLLRLSAFHFVLLPNEEPSNRYYNGIVEPCERRMNYTHYQTVSNKLRKPEIESSAYKNIREIDMQYANAKKALNVDKVQGLSSVFNINLLNVQSSDVFKMLGLERSKDATKDSDVEDSNLEDSDPIYEIETFNSPRDETSRCYGDENMDTRTEISEETKPLPSYADELPSALMSSEASFGEAPDKHLFTVKPMSSFDYLGSTSATNSDPRKPSPSGERSQKSIEEIRARSVFNTLSRHRPTKWHNRKSRND